MHKGWIAAMASLFGSQLPSNYTGSFPAGNSNATKATRKAEARRRKNANRKALRRVPADHSKPTGNRAARKAAARQLGVTRRGY